MQTEISKAVRVLRQALTTDEWYRNGWKANIAMSFYDEFKNRYGNDSGIEDLHDIANAAADNFLNLLTYTDTTQDSE